MPVFAIVLAVAIQVAAQAPAVPGSLVGCVVDTTTQRLPGATIVAKGGGVQRTTVANAAGCYELKDLPPALYRVTARLTGFDNVTRDGVVLAPATVTHLDFTTRVSPICECVTFRGSLADWWNRSDAVLYVRISDSDPGQTTPRGVYRHVATALNVLKQPGGGPRAGPIFVFQNQSSGAPEPYDVGQELVMFLMSSGSNGFVITNDDPGLARGRSPDDYPAMVFLVQDDRIQRAPSDFSGYVGLRLDVFLAELRALSRAG
jgi:hypothetical protein